MPGMPSKPDIVVDSCDLETLVDNLNQAGIPVEPQHTSKSGTYNNGKNEVSGPAGTDFGVPVVHTRYTIQSSNLGIEIVPINIDVGSNGQGQQLSLDGIQCNMRYKGKGVEADKIFMDVAKVVRDSYPQPNSPNNIDVAALSNR